MFRVLAYADFPPRAPQRFGGGAHAERSMAIVREEVIEFLAARSMGGPCAWYDMRSGLVPVTNLLTNPLWAVSAAPDPV